MTGSDIKITRAFSVQTEISKEETVVLRASTSLTCKAAAVNVLTDNDGASISNYEAAMRGEKNPDRFQFERPGNGADIGEIASVGFSEQFAEGATVKSFLAESGYSAEEGERIIDEYELRRHSYLYCAQLPPPSIRQLWLLRALRSQAPTLLLRDPFQPFNGRWREHFAKLILHEASSRKRTIICTWVSFVPQAWSAEGAIRSVDVGDLAYLAAKKAKSDEILRRGREEKSAPKKVEREVLKPSELTFVENPKDKNGQPAYQLPENLSFGYRATRDYIFQPLADFSNFARHHAVVSGLFAFALTLATMMTVMVPNLPGLRAKLRTLHYDMNWSQILEAIRAEPKVKEVKLEEDPNEIAIANPTVIVEHSEIVPGEELVAENNVEPSAVEVAPLEESHEFVIPEYLNGVDFAGLVSIDDPNMEIALDGWCENTQLMTEL